MSQLLEEEDHRRTAGSNRRDLLVEKLASLRGLVRHIQADDWMYCPRGGGGGNGNNGNSGVPAGPYGVATSATAIKGGNDHNHAATTTTTSDHW